jgi:hypothetical protein
VLDQDRPHRCEEFGRWARHEECGKRSVVALQLASGRKRLALTPVAREGQQDLLFDSDMAEKPRTELLVRHTVHFAAMPEGLIE